MSSGKDFDSKVPQDSNVDCGFFSGPIDTDVDVADVDANVDSGFLSAPLDLKESSDLSDHTRSERLCGAVDGDEVELCTQNLLNLELNDFATPTIDLSQRRSRHASSEGRPTIQSLFQQDDDGDTNLHIAAAQGCTKSVAILIKICPDKALLDIQNDYRHTALHLAVMGGYSVVAKMLVLEGASLALRDVCGRTPVHIAAETGDVECLTALLSPVVEQPERNLRDILHQKDYNGQTCVHAAASAGHIKTLQTLVYFHADINVKEGLAGWTALHIAARQTDGRVARFLLEDCAGVNEHARDYGGRTPRRLARRTANEYLFSSRDSDDDSSDDNDYDSEGETLFDQLQKSLNPINVA